MASNYSVTRSKHSQMYWKVILLGRVCEGVVVGAANHDFKGEENTGRSGTNFSDVE